MKFVRNLSLTVLLLALLPVSPTNMQPAFSLSRVFLPLVSESGCWPPVLNLPQDGAQLSTLRPVFAFLTPPGRDQGYTYVTIARDAMLSDIDSVYLITRSGAPSFRSFRNLRPATEHFWQARVACGGQPVFSPIWHFRTGSDGVILPSPNPMLPPDDATGLGPQITLSWSGIPAAQGYWVHVGQAGKGGGTFYDRVEPKLTINNLVANTQYEWSVQAYNDYAYGQSSIIWRFTTASYAPTIQAHPVERAPVDGVQLIR